MATVRVGVSLDEQDLQWLRKQAEEKGKSLSAVLGDAVRQARRAWALDQVLHWMDAPQLSVERLDAYRRLWGSD